GRPLSQGQQFFYLNAWGSSYTTQQTYNLAGGVTSQTYPSNHTTTTNYDAAGGVNTFNGNLGVGGAEVNYADTISYNAAGQTIKERFGTQNAAQPSGQGLYHNLHYNNRLQLVDTRLGDSATDEWNWSRGATAFLYGTTAVAIPDMFASDTDNNGNPLRPLNYVPLATR